MNPDALVTRSQLCADLRRLGLERGDTVMVHAAMRRVGPLLNGPDALVNALLDAVGPAGTVVAYTSWDTLHDDLLDDGGRVLDAWRAHVPPFDPLRSRATRLNGALPEFLRTTPGALRSGNPGASVAAVGAQAAPLTADHPQDFGYGPGTPLSRLLDLDGKVLMVGAPWDTMTLLHHAEHLAALPGKRVIDVEVPFASPRGTRWQMVREFDTSEPVIDALPEDCFEQIVQAFVAAGGGQQGLVGRAPSLLVPARAVCAFGVQWLEDFAGGQGFKD
jgi:aminoglycoside 3-N-acetyltransferase